MQHWAITDPGCVRPQNQDAFAVEQLDKSSLLCLVCDGMGGARSGNIASELAADVFVQEIRRTYRSGMSLEQTADALRNAGKLANYTVYDQSCRFPEFHGMGTTLVAALVSGRRACVLNVGDSRAYLIDRHGIRRVTQDHSLVEMMLQRGEVTSEEARRYPGRNLITRAIGTESTVQCDLFYLDLERGDYLLLCSDGLSNLLDDQELLFEVVHGVGKRDCCRRLLDIAKRRGAPDNVTCVLVQV